MFSQLKRITFSRKHKSFGSAFSLILDASRSSCSLCAPTMRCQTLSIFTSLSFSLFLSLSLSFSRRERASALFHCSSFHPRVFAKTHSVRVSTSGLSVEDGSTIQSAWAAQSEGRRTRSRWMTCTKSITSRHAACSEASHSISSSGRTAPTRAQAGKLYGDLKKRQEDETLEAALLAAANTE